MPPPWNVHSSQCSLEARNSTDVMPAQVDLPVDIDVGDHIEFGSIGAYSLSGRTDFNGFYSDEVVAIVNGDALPPE